MNTSISAPRDATTPERPPEYVEINVGLPCNNSCLFCIHGDVRGSDRLWRPATEARAELRHLRDMGRSSVCFVGGEPTAYPHIVDVIGWAKEFGYRGIALCTNGTKFSDAAFVDELLKAGATHLTISFHSRLPEVEDALTGLPGNFERKLQGLKTLLSRKAAGVLTDNVSLAPVLNRRNYQDISGYIEFFHGLGVDVIHFNYIWPKANVLGDKKIVPSYREAMPEIARAIILNERRWRTRLSFGGVPSCMLRWSGLDLSAHASTYFAERYFDRRTNGRDRLRTHAPVCASCPRYEGCDGVWKSYADIWGLGELNGVEAA